MVPMNLVLVDANQLSREGLLHVLQGMGIDVVDGVGCADELPVGSSPGVILANCGEMVEWIAGELPKLRRACPAARIVVIAPEDAPELLSLHDQPIDGLVTGNVSSAALLKTLELVLAGERVMPSRLISMAILQHERRNAAASRQAERTGSSSRSVEPALSEREIEILQCLVDGDSNKMIAIRLGIAEATAKVHLKSILRKVQVRNRTQAAVWAMERGMLPRHGQAGASPGPRWTDRRTARGHEELPRVAE